MTRHEGYHYFFLLFYLTFLYGLDMRHFRIIIYLVFIMILIMKNENVYLFVDNS